MSEDELGFSPVGPHGLKKILIDKVLNKIQNKLLFHTSTPNSKLSVMDLSFPKCYKKMSQSFIDSDSGYISRNHDSNSENSEMFVQSFQYKPENCVYISEDALLEKPKSLQKDVLTDSVYEEFSQLYYINNIVDDSVSPVKSAFSGLQDSDTSLKSTQSSELQPEEAIVITKEKLELLESFDPKLKVLNTNVGELNSSSLLETSYQSDNSNIENNINLANIPQNCNKKSPKKTLKRKRSISKTPRKQYKNNVNASFSPDLFSDEEIYENPQPKIETPIVPERFITTADKLLMKRLNRSLRGVLPPPSVTTTKLTVAEILEKIEVNKEYFWDGECDVKSVDKKRSLLINTDCKECIHKSWPDILEDRYHGLHYNRSKLSEELEALYSKYSQRYIGAETQSTCTTFAIQGSPSKRKANRQRWNAKSPGRRLSHLARRRITFSSANLQSNSSNITSARQIMVDARRYDLTRRISPRKTKSPRKTPRRSPRKLIKTPSSSIKKRLEFRLSLLNDREEAGPSNVLRTSATKRALFQSPDKITLQKINKIGQCTSSTSSPSSLKKKSSHKRALFVSPAKSTCSENDVLQNNKRKRLDSEDSMPCKLPRSISMMDNQTDNKFQPPLSKVKSENSLLSQQATELSAHHKKKLQWAVYEALRSQSIGVSHPQFKQFASVLARVIRRLLPNTASVPKNECGTSERMLRIAKQHVFNIIKGKTLEEIIGSVQKGRVKQQKPQGYVGLDEAVNQQVDVSIARNAFQDRANIINSTEKNKIGHNDKTIKSTNKADRVRKIINFDDDSSLGSLRSSF